MKKITTMLFVLAISLCMNNNIFAQANSVGLNGSFTFNSIATAYAAIGVVGSPQLIELSAGYTGANETAPISLTNKTGASLANTITIRPSAGANGLTLSKAAANYIFRLDSCKFVTIDGRPGGVTSSASNYLNITNTTLGATSGTVGMFGAENCNFQYTNSTGVSGSTGARVVNIAGGVLVASKNNSVFMNVIKGGLRGVQCFGTTVAVINGSNIISNNDISQFFNIGILSSNDTATLITQNSINFTSAIPTIATFLTGMQIQGTRTVFTQNDIHDFKSTNCTNFSYLADFGINSVITNNKFHDFTYTPANPTQFVGIQMSGVSGATTLSGNEFYNLNFPTSSVATTFNIAVSVSASTAINTCNVFGNKIHDMTNANVGSATVTSIIRGLQVFASAGNTANLYNNFIALTSPNPGASSIQGIILGGSGASTVAYTSNVSYNSIRIGGTKAVGISGATNSVGIWRNNDNAGSVFTSRNNIVLNERKTGDANTMIQLGSWVDNINGTITVNYNTYKSTDTVGGFDAAWRDTLYRNAGIVGYQAYASPNEANTNFKATTFVSNTDLHLAGPSIGDPTLIGTPIAGITTDIDGNPRGTVKPYKGADEAAGMCALTLTVKYESCPDPEPVTVELRNSTAPYAVVESVNGIAGGNVASVIHFGNAVNGTPYYITVRSLNSIKTWSASTVTFTSFASSFNFTSAVGQAFGNNQIVSGGIPSFYQGDVNGDGFINLTDVLAIYGVAIIFSSTPETNLDCSGDTDLTDIITAFNNSKAFIEEKKPAGATTIPGPIQSVDNSYHSNGNTVTKTAPVQTGTDNVFSAPMMDR